MQFVGNVRQDTAIQILRNAEVMRMPEHSSAFSTDMKCI